MATRTSSEPRVVWSVDDLTGDEIQFVLDRAATLSELGSCRTGEPFTVGLVFLASSLRTRVGYAAAAARLGGQSIEIVDQRWTPEMSTAESLADTVRTVSGMVDVVVVRVPRLFGGREIRSMTCSPTLNGGDGGGDDGEHPSQALIDLFAIERRRGPVEHLHVALCGDLSTRVARSTLRLLDRRPPRRLTLVAPSSRMPRDGEVPERLAERTEWMASLASLSVDAISMIGLAPGEGANALDETIRAKYRLTGEHLRGLDADALVLSPLPVIDEVDEAVRADPRCIFFDQSNDGVFVRMALLELLLGRSGPSIGGR